MAIDLVNGHFAFTQLWDLKKAILTKWLDTNMCKSTGPDLVLTGDHGPVEWDWKFLQLRLWVLFFFSSILDWYKSESLYNRLYKVDFWQMRGYEMCDRWAIAGGAGYDFSFHTSESTITRQRVVDEKLALWYDSTWKPLPEGEIGAHYSQSWIEKCWRWREIIKRETYAGNWDVNGFLR